MDQSNPNVKTTRVPRSHQPARMYPIWYPLSILYPLCRPSSTGMSIFLCKNHGPMSLYSWHAGHSFWRGQVLWRLFLWVPFVQHRKVTAAGKVPLACNSQPHHIWALVPLALPVLPAITVLPPSRNSCYPRDQQKCPPLPSLALPSFFFSLATMGLLTISSSLSGLLLL